MDEPKRSAARTSRYLIPIGFVILLVAGLWPEQEVHGRITITYSRLLGFRVEDQPSHAKQMAAGIVRHLGWLVVAVAALRPMSERGRTLVYGAAGVYGLIEILGGTGTLIHGEFPRGSSALGVVGGVLLIAGAIAGLGRAGDPEIREAEGARA